MTVTKLSNNENHVGLSTDVKPDAPNGSTFFELDSKDLYFAVANVWYLRDLGIDGDYRQYWAEGVSTTRSTEHVVGENADVAISSTEGVAPAGLMPFLEAGTTIRIKAGGNAADTAAGAGARKVVVEALLASDWSEVTIELTTAGASASAASSESIIRINRAYVSDSGTYGAVGAGKNTAAITIETVTSPEDLIVIGAGRSNSESSLRTIPAGKTGYLRGWHIGVEANKVAQVRLWKREDADTVAAPFTSPQQVDLSALSEAATGHEYNSVPSFPEKTDVWVEATAGSGGTSGISADYELSIVDN